MISSRRLLAAMAGFAMLAMPVSAFAGHRHDGERAARPYAFHDRGFHNGWNNHQSVPMRQVRRGYAQPYNEGRWNRPYSEGRWNRPFAWSNGNRGCDADGDNCRVAPNPIGGYYGCDADGDDCGQVNGWRGNYGYNNNYYGYGAPIPQDYSWYQALPPTGYSLVQQRDWLMARRHRAMAVLAGMRARGDRRGADRMVPIVRALNSRINTINRRLGVGYARNSIPPYLSGSAYAPANGYAPVNGYGSPLASLLGSPYAGASAPYYPANSYYGNSPVLNALGAIASPMLGLP